MIRLAFRSLAQHKLRTVLTTVAILLGVAMISGTYVLTDQINGGFKNIYDSAMGEIDVIVTPKPAFGDALGGQNETLSAAMLTAVRKVDGVQQAQGGVQALGTAIVNGKAISTSGAPTLVLSDMGEKFNNVSWTGGTHPTDGSVAVDTGFLTKQHLKIGDRFGLGTSHGVQPVTISGTFDFGAKGSSMGGTILIAGTLADIQRWYDMRDKFSYIDASRAPGVSREELTARLRAALPKTLQVKTGAQSAADGTKAVTTALGPLRTFLLAFGGIALLVGAFIIFNTFSITVAQRRREFAMLRTLGASRRQVLGSVITEAVILGIAASVAGLFLGLGVAKGMNALFKAFGADIPVGGLTMQPRTIAYALAIGILVTLLASVIPALRATRVPPVAALQHGAQLPASRFSRYTPILGGLFAAVGAGVIAMGFVTHGTTSQRLLEMGLGALLLFVAVAMLARYIVRPVALVLGLVIERIAGTSGRLARENAVRNPGRTASTAASLMIGLAVVVFVAVLAAGLKSSFADAIDTSVRADLVVSSSGSTMLPVLAAETARNVPSVDYVTALTTTEVKLPDGKTGSLGGIVPDDMHRVWSFHWLQGGSDSLLARVGTTGALVEEQFALAHKLSVGEHVRVLARSGKTASFTVIGEFRDPTSMLSGMVVGENAFAPLAGRSEAMYIVVKALPGSDLPAAQKAVAAALKQYPAAKVQTKAEFVTSLRKQIDQMLMMLYALLAVSVLISVFGIVNTLVLSVYERTREIGMLRAIGATRRQIRRMVRYESVITAIMGGALGIVVGTVFAYVVTTEFGGQGLTFTVPGAQLAVFMVIAIVVGVLAAVLPARRASRVDILQAIQYE
jgi:putative ABC transport system permease protein